MRALLLAAALLAPLLVPVASAAVDVTSVSALFTPRDMQEGELAYTVSFTGAGGSTRWPLTIPEGARFESARDRSGPLGAQVDGQTVTVTSRGSSGAFTVVFAIPATRDGPFLRLQGSVFGYGESPASATLALPEGWRLAGYRAADSEQELTLDPDGVVRHEGPFHADWLLLPPGVPDPGPDGRAHGNHVARAGHADVRRNGTTLDLTVVYDTDVYRRDWSLIMPTGATFVSAHAPLGEVDARVEGDEVRVTTPYPTGHHLGGRPFSLRFELPAPTAFGGGFLQANLSIPAGPDDSVTLSYELEEGLRFVGADPNGAFVDADGEVLARGPMTVAIALLPPLPDGHVRFEAGAYVVQAPVELEATARATALRAAEILPTAAGFAGGGNVTSPFFVAYSRDDVFGWEAGFYSTGRNAISIRASELEARNDGQAHLVPVATLVHETLHGLLDRLYPDAPGGLSFFHEGLARLAETHVESYFPDEVVSCEQEGFGGQSCSRHSARPEAGLVYANYTGSFRFPLEWNAATVPESQRGFLYDHSGLVFHAYVAQAPPTALRDALDDVLALPPTDAAGLADLLVERLLAHAPDLTQERLLYPGIQAASQTQERFAACMAFLVAPPYPFEPARPNPTPAQCGGFAPERAKVEASLQAGAATPPERAGPLLPEPTVVPAIPQPPPPPPPEDPDEAPEAHGEPPQGDPALDDPGAPAVPGTSAPTPGAPLPLVAALLLGLGLAVRRRQA